MAKCRTIGCEGEAFTDAGFCHECGFLENTGLGKYKGDKRPEDQEDIKNRKVKTKEDNNMAGSKHAICIIDSCTKVRVKEQMCTRHYNEKHGIVKKAGPVLGKKQKKRTTYKKNRKAREYSKKEKTVRVDPQQSRLSQIPGLIKQNIEIIKEKLAEVEALI